MIAPIWHQLSKPGWLSPRPEGKVPFVLGSNMIQTRSRCFYLARCYAPIRGHAEALTLLQHAIIHIRETSNSLSILTHDPISSVAGHDFFTLSIDDVKSFEDELAKDSLQYKRDWFGYNGGSLIKNPKEYEKPTFFNIALNYVPLNMEQLLKRAGKTAAALDVPGNLATTRTVAQVTTPAPAKPSQVEGPPEKKPTVKAKVEEVRPLTPEPQTPARGGISSLLGAWWGRS